MKKLEFKFQQLPLSSQSPIMVQKEPGPHFCFTNIMIMS